MLGNLSDADFLVTNYKKRIRKNFIIDEKKYVKYFEIIVDGAPINTVYKIINYLNNIINPKNRKTTKAIFL